MNPISPISPTVIQAAESRLSAAEASLRSLEVGWLLGLWVLVSSLRVYGFGFWFQV